jgi:PhnB protein
MAGLTPYIHFPGTARAALTFYSEVFGCGSDMYTFEQFSRSDGPADAIAHGYLTGGPVSLFASDASDGQQPFRSEGLMFSLLGTADPATLHAWFARLSEDGKVVDELQKRPWGASDGQVIDRFGLHWLLGYEEEEA